jgi:hypothetical protein
MNYKSAAFTGGVFYCAHTSSSRTSPSSSRAQRSDPSFFKMDCFVRSGAAGRHRLGQDLHHGQGHRGDPAPGPDPRPQQDAGGPALFRVPELLPRQRGRVFRLLLRLLPRRRPMSRAPIPISRRTAAINEQIDRMRHAATRALLERDDVIVVASVSCIYGIGSVETYSAMTFQLKKGERIDHRQLLADLVALQYKRNDQAFRARHIPRARRHHRALPRRTWRTAPGASRCSATRSNRSRSSIP